MIFDTEHFTNLTGNQRFPAKLIALDSAPSTNQWLKSCDTDCFEHGVLVLADHQTKGRGQYQREWISEPGVNITCSLGLRPRGKGSVHRLIFLMGAGIALALEKMNIPEVSLKWPNDVLVNGKKAGGILTETTFRGNTLSRVIIGFGLNVNQRNMSPNLQRIATSLLLETGTVWPREELLASVLNEFEKLYRMWELDQTEWKEHYNHFLTGMNKPCRFVISTGGQESKKVRGRCKGLQPDGTLKIETDDGEIMKFSHEEIRIYPLES